MFFADVHLLTPPPPRSGQLGGHLHPPRLVSSPSPTKPLSYKVTLRQPQRCPRPREPLGRVAEAPPQESSINLNSDPVCCGPFKGQRMSFCCHKWRWREKEKKEREIQFPVCTCPCCSAKKKKKKMIATVQPVFKGSQVFPAEAAVDNRSLCSPRNTRSLLGFKVSVRAS